MPATSPIPPLSRPALIQTSPTILSHLASTVPACTTPRCLRLRRRLPAALPISYLLSSSAASSISSDSVLRGRPFGAVGGWRTGGLSSPVLECRNDGRCSSSIVRDVVLPGGATHPFPSFSPSFAGQRAAIVSVSTKASPEPAVRTAGLSVGRWLVFSIHSRGLAELCLVGMLPEVRRLKGFDSIMVSFVRMGVPRCGLPAGVRTFGAQLLGNSFCMLLLWRIRSVCRFVGMLLIPPSSWAVSLLLMGWRGCRAILPGRRWLLPGVCGLVEMRCPACWMDLLGPQGRRVWLDGFAGSSGSTGLPWGGLCWERRRFGLPGRGGWWVVFWGCWCLEIALATCTGDGVLEFAEVRAGFGLHAAGVLGVLAAVLAGIG